MKLDANNAVPLYEQLKMTLRSQIESQLLLPGDRIPAEAELCKKYQVSRVTVRCAVDTLVEEGYLERRQGKGTFVAAKRAQVFMTPINDAVTGFSESDEYAGEKSIRVIDKNEYSTNKREQELLRLEETDKVLVLSRVMLRDGKPWMLDRATYSAKRYPGFFDIINDDVSTYSVLRSRYGVVMKRSHKEVSIAYATNEQAKQLGCAPSAPLFKMFKVVYDDKDEPVHMSNSYFKADQIVFTVDNEVSASGKGMEIIDR